MGVAAVDVRRVRRAACRPRPGARERAARGVERPKRRFAAARGRLDGRDLYAYRVIPARLGFPLYRFDGVRPGVHNPALA